MTPPNNPPVRPTGAEASPPAVHPVVVDSAQVPERRGTVAFLASIKRDGAWTLPRLFRAVAFMGEVKIDLTRARLGTGESRIELKVIMGNITVLVPPDIRVEYDVDPTIGSFDVCREVESTTAINAPFVHISGSAFMGAVEVKIIDPNSPKRRAKWRSLLLGE
ncbi:MAG TPA: LiaF domain-containing protein [Gemmatimonadaceae bacterium]|nr:LiaF domain-containing protein [Gemmatimonadaceae bacterium]